MIALGWMASCRTLSLNDDIRTSSFPASEGVALLLPTIKAQEGQGESSPYPTHLSMNSQLIYSISFVESWH